MERKSDQLDSRAAKKRRISDERKDEKDFRYIALVLQDIENNEGANLSVICAFFKHPAMAVLPELIKEALALAYLPYFKKAEKRLTAKEFLASLLDRKLFKPYLSCLRYSREFAFICI
jgi:hypothetical protein